MGTEILTAVIGVANMQMTTNQLSIIFDSTLKKE